MKRLALLTILVFAIVLAGPAMIMSGPPGPVQNRPPDGWNVNINNQPVEVTGDVNATVTGEVNVANTPDVYVVNGETSPVPVTGAVNVIKTIEPVSDAAGAFLNVNCPYSDEVYTVPDGKLLIIEDASGGMVASANPHAIIPDGGVNLKLYVTDSTGTILVHWYVTVVAGNELPLNGGRPVRLYAGPGEIVKVALAGCSQPVNAEVRFVGQFINVP